MFDAKVIAQGLLKLLVEGAAVGEGLAGPDLLKIRNELLQRRQVGLGDVDGWWAHYYLSSNPAYVS